ncbi:hypothetical protein [Dokdonella soli]|uniref:Peptidase M61 catalytic domain-containing protein n=1 Tax=Dokdonella soli TaxID=529810 RepID=A0ABN1IRW7_9GAMM
MIAMPTTRTLAGCLAALLLSIARPGSAAAPNVFPQIAQRAAACVADQRFAVGDSVVELTFDPAAFAVGATPVCRWVAQAATAVAGYFGRFPVRHEHVVIRPVDGDGVHGGTTWGAGDTDGRPLSVIRLGRAVTLAELDDDWVMTHEMVHLAVPSVPRNSHWLEEGIATYVEPIARVQQGQLSAKKVWADMLHGMPKGLPAEGDRGLDRTPTWGRTYWGGALFCLLADVEIRRRTHNRSGLREALRGVIAAGGNIEQDWPVAKIIRIADDATRDAGALAGLYSEMGDAPGPADIDSLWRRLGVVADGAGIRFVDDAPDAAIRKAITATDATGAYSSPALTLGGHYVVAFGAIPPDLSFYYPAYVCAYPNCSLANAQAVQLGAAQNYPNIDLAIPHLDLIFRGGFDP